MRQRKFQAKVQEKRRQQERGAQVEPEDRPVETVELSRVVEDVIDKRRQTDKIKVQGVWGARTFEQDECANQKIQ